MNDAAAITQPVAERPQIGTTTSTAISVQPATAAARPVQSCRLSIQTAGSPAVTRITSWVPVRPKK